MCCWSMCWAAGVEILVFDIIVALTATRLAQWYGSTNIFTNCG
jgi:hypothetical protein